MIVVIIDQNDRDHWFETFQVLYMKLTMAFVKHDRPTDSLSSDHDYFPETRANLLVPGQLMYEPDLKA